MTMYYLAQEQEKLEFRNDFYKTLVASRGDKKSVNKFEAQFKD